jgi:uncharacterized protein (UPF0147 family)
MAMNEQMKQIVDSLTALLDDSVVPRNVKIKLEAVIKILNEDTDVSIKVNKALHELDDVADDSNMQPFTRTQIWNVVSILETL